VVRLGVQDYSVIYRVMLTSWERSCRRTMCVKAEIELEYQAMGYCAAKIVGVWGREL